LRAGIRKRRPRVAAGFYRDPHTGRHRHARRTVSVRRRLVLKQVGLMLLVGGAIGVVAAIALGRAARSLLFELQGHDPAAVAASVVLLACVAFAAGFIPARRAAMVNPMNALRYD